MKLLKPNQRNYWCSFCPPKTTKATHRSNNRFQKFACSEHKLQLQEWEQQHSDSNHLTEADYQTWMRL